MLRNDAAGLGVHRHRHSSSPRVLHPLTVLVRRLSLRFRPDTRAGFVQGTHAMGPAMIGIAAWGLVTGIFKQLSLARRTCIGYLNGDLNFVVFTQRYPKVLAEPGKEGFFFGVSATRPTRGGPDPRARGAE
jgi:hypothetical protein